MTFKHFVIWLKYFVRYFSIIWLFFFGQQTFIHYNESKIGADNGSRFDKIGAEKSSLSNRIRSKSGGGGLETQPWWLIPAIAFLATNSAQSFAGLGIFLQTILLKCDTSRRLFCKIMSSRQARSTPTMWLMTMEASNSISTICQPLWTASLTASHTALASKYSRWGWFLLHPVQSPEKLPHI